MTDPVHSKVAPAEVVPLCALPSCGEHILLHELVTTFGRYPDVHFHTKCFQASPIECERVARERSNEDAEGEA